jgi:hypothetical protein
VEFGAAALGRVMFAYRRGEAIEWGRMYFEGGFMERPKAIAVVTGAISLVLGVVYLVLVQILDSREMVPAPILEMLSIGLG